MAIPARRVCEMIRVARNGTLCIEARDSFLMRLAIKVGAQSRLTESQDFNDECLGHKYVKPRYGSARHKSTDAAVAIAPGDCMPADLAAEDTMQSDDKLSQWDLHPCRPKMFS
jgi:hypothetical protein